MSAALLLIAPSPWPGCDEATATTAMLLNRLSTETELVPAWWLIEITNVLALAKRKGRLTPTQSNAFIADLTPVLVLAAAFFMTNPAGSCSCSGYEVVKFVGKARTWRRRHSQLPVRAQPFLRDVDEVAAGFP